MYYKLIVKLIEENETSKDCRYLPEKSNFGIYLQAFLEDINNISLVLMANVDSKGCILIKTKNNISESQLCEAMKPVFNSFFCKIKYKSIIQLN